MAATLVTGGAGFIGSHLCGFLLNKRRRVLCLDSLLTGSRKNISPFSENDNFSFIEHDITKPISLTEDIDEVYSLASPASPVDYAAMPVETMLANSAGVHNALDIAKEKKAKFLQASTSEIYGSPLEHPQKESYWGNVNPVGPRSCYDESKRFAEALVASYRRKHGLDTRIVRIFNTYGPRMRISDGRVMPNFIMAALQDKPIEVYGNGSQTRSFCYVSDLVSGLSLCMEKGNHEPINIGNPEEVTIRQLAERIIKLTASSSEIITKPLPQDDPERRKPDITKAGKVLGWKPELSLEQGLAPTIDYFRAFA
jgi:dTDP-glucose 4,6-dehydratase